MFSSVDARSHYLERDHGHDRGVSIFAGIAFLSRCGSFFHPQKLDDSRIGERGVRGLDGRESVRPAGVGFLVTVGWAVLGTLLICQKTIGFCLDKPKGMEGLDYSLYGEHAYGMLILN